MLTQFRLQVCTAKLVTFRNIPLTYLTVGEGRNNSFGRVFETDAKTLGDRISRLWFSGDATNIWYYGTTVAAWNTEEMAANDVIGTITCFLRTVDRTLSNFPPAFTMAVPNSLPRLKFKLFIHFAERND